MKLSNLSILLFAAACGGGGDTNPQPVDSPTTDGGGFFPNSRNDVFLITFPEAGLTAGLTPDTGDAPDNATALNIGQTGGSGISGEMGIAGDHSDDYFERDTYLIATGANVNQLTIRMDWDGGQADMDWILFEEPAAGATDFTVFGSGTLISDGLDEDTGNPVGEFVTFTVDPSKNYLLWGGVFNILSAGGGPSLPKPYDFSIYGANVTPASLGTCTINEGNDNNNSNNGLETFGGVATAKVGTALTITTAAPQVYCGTLNTGNFALTPEATDPMAGTDDVDAFAFNLPVEGDLLVTITGGNDADNTAIQGLLANGALQVALFNDPCTANNCVDVDAATQGVQKRPQQFFSNSLTTFIGTHGVEAFHMIDSAFADPNSTTTPPDVVGPKTLGVFLQSTSPGILTANLTYKIKVEVDNRTTRAGRISAPELSEANDN